MRGEPKKRKPLTAGQKKWLIFGCVMGVGLLVLIGYVIYARMPLDRLEEYRVQVEVNEDGSMEITYRYRWRVLDDSKEGPLEWVSLGLPNRNCRVTDYGGAIISQKRIRNESSGDILAEFYLNRGYYKGETADFYFTVHQESMLCRNTEKEDRPFYDFTPGWFDEIEVEHYRFEWEDSPGVLECNADRKENGVYVWEGALENGERRELKVYYDLAAFENPELVTWTASSGGVSGGSGADPSMIAFIVLGFGFIGYRIAWGRDEYENGRGYCGVRGYRGGSRGGGCACACAGCACACACAGGGRAGCSKKELL